MARFSEAKIGEEVWCTCMGEGRIIHVDKAHPNYPIHVKFNVNISKAYSWEYNTYTWEGKMSRLFNYPCLFRNKPDAHTLRRRG